MQKEIDERILSVLDRIDERLAVLADLERVLPRIARTLPQPQKGRTGVAETPPPTHVPGGGNDEETWLELSEDEVAGVMAPFANAQRVKLLKALYLGIAESGQLKEFTGLTGGQLYHHLKELALAKFLSRHVRGEYRLSSFGYYAFSALMILAHDLLTQETDEEVVKPEEIELD